MGRRVVHLNIIFPLNQKELIVSADLLLLMIVMRLLKISFKSTEVIKYLLAFTYFPDLIRKFRH